MQTTAAKPVLTALREMETGASIEFPISRMSYVSSACVRFGAEWQKTFKTSLDRGKGTIKVTRTA